MILRSFAWVNALALVLASVSLGQTASVVVQATSGTVCPKCGVVHGAQPSSAAVHTSYKVAPSAGSYVTTASPSSSGGGVSNVLSALNSQRARSGLRPLGYDPSLQAVAERRALQMARSGSKSHPPGSFSPGTHEGVGWSSSYSPSGVSACYTSDSRMKIAGAAMATGRDGVYFAVVYR